LADPQPHPTKPDRPLAGLEASSLGLQIAAGFGLFVGLGYWADHRLGTSPLLVLVGLVLGMAYMLYELWKLARAPGGAASDKRGSGATEPKG